LKKQANRKLPINIWQLSKCLVSRKPSICQTLVFLTATLYNCERLIRLTFTEMDEIDNFQEE
jgi:hypothetical protein